MNTTQKHLAAIRSDSVTKTNVIGIRKAIAANDRRESGYSVGSTSPKATADEVAKMLEALRKREPLVRGELHASGVRILTNPRWRKRFKKVQDVIDTLHGFRLVGFDYVRRRNSFTQGREWESIQPVYRAVGTSGSFLFMNVPWQSGGDGPEIV